MERYVDRPKDRRSVSFAARYAPEKVSSRDDLLAVARQMHSDAEIAEVPSLRVAVVRYLRVPDDHPAQIEYEVVEAGSYLVYSETFDLLYSSDPETFAKEHERA
jgi:hypothetical protein